MDKVKQSSMVVQDEARVEQIDFNTRRRKRKNIYIMRLLVDLIKQGCVTSGPPALLIIVRLNKK